MSGINSNNKKVELTHRELYEKYKGCAVVTEHGGRGIIVGYTENIWENDYPLIASVIEDEGWDWLYGDDIIPDYKGSEDDRAFLYVKEEGIVK